MMEVTPAHATVDTLEMEKSAVVNILLREIENSALNGGGGCISLTMIGTRCSYIVLAKACHFNDDFNCWNY